MTFKARSILRAAAVTALAAGAAHAADTTFTLIPQVYWDAFNELDLTAQRINISGLSADGTTFIGTIRANPNGGGDFDRAYTFDYATSDRVTILQYPDYSEVTVPGGVADDGSIVFGAARVTGTSQRDAVWWNASAVPTNLGRPSGANTATAVDASSDLSRFVGTALFPINGSNVSRVVLWDSGVSTILNGADGQPITGSAVNISSDGSTVLINSASSTTGYLQWTNAGVTEAPDPAPVIQGVKISGDVITTPGMGDQYFADYLASRGYTLSDALGFTTTAYVAKDDKILVAGNFSSLNAAGYTFLDIPDDPTMWKNDAGGSWSDGANWTAPTPSGAGVAARLGNVITAARTVSLDSNWEVGHLFIDSEHAYTLSGLGSLQLHSPMTPELKIDRGSHSISTPIVFSTDNTDSRKAGYINIVRAQDTLTISNISCTTSSLRVFKKGAGTLVISDGADLSGMTGALWLLEGETRAGRLSLPGGLTLSITDQVISYSGASNPPVLHIGSLNAGNLSVSNHGQVNITPDGVDIALNVNGLTFTNDGNVRIAPDGTRAGLSVVRSTLTGPTYTSSGALSGTGVVDLTNNAMIVRSTSSAALGSSLTTTSAVRHYRGNVIASIDRARNSGTAGLWTGNGLTSNTAAANPELYAVGIATAGKALGFTGTPTGQTFFGEAINSQYDRLIRFTYLGDTNLDGAVTPADYMNIDAAWTLNTGGVRTAIDGWFSGDFDYDTYITLNDYLAMDRVYQLTGHDLLASGALTPTSPYYTQRLAAIPEPAALATLGLIATLVLWPRRQHRIVN